MPGNDFEKQVQQKMDELQFAPSAAVWQQVEARIAPRRRRRLFFWLPLLFILAGGGWWILTTQGGKPGEPMAKQPAAASNSNQMANEYTAEPTYSPAHKTQSDSSIVSSDTRATVGANHSDAAIVSSVNNELRGELQHTNLAGSQAPAVQLTGHNSKGQTKKAMAASRLRRREPNTSGWMPGAEGFEVPLPTLFWGAKPPDKQDATEPDLHGYLFDFSPGRLAAGSIEAPIHKDAGIPAAAPSDKKKPAKKIEWAVAIDGGWTNSISSFPAGIGRTPVYNNSLLFAGNVSTIPLGNTASPTTSDLRPAGGFSAGISFKKPLGHRFSVTAGLRYSLYSAKLLTGSKVDSARTQTFRTGSQFGFTNTYRLIELPLGVEHSLGRWTGSAGVMAGWIVASNSVHYDFAGSAYKDAASLQQSFQYGLELGLRYQLLKRLPALEIGPSFRYGWSKLSSQANDGGQHLFFGGISIRYWPHKK